jgi:hypothetical protein
MATWTWRAYDLVTGSFLTELSMQEWSSIDVLNSAGSFTANLLVPEDSDAVQAVRGSTTPGKSYVVAFREEQPVFGGVVWRRLYRSASRMVALSGRGLMSHLERFDIADDLSYAATDQLAIARDLLARAGTRYTGARAEIELGTEMSGVLRDRSYARWDRKPHGVAIAELAAVIDGFDWALRPEVDEGELVRVFRLWYPRRGRTFEASGISFRTGTQAVLFDVPEDGTKLAASVTAQGAGDGPDMLLFTSSSTELPLAGFPAYTATVPHRTVTTDANLREHARGELARRSRTDWDAYTVQIDPTYADLPWGAWDLGDDVQLVVEDDPWFPLGSDGTPGLVALRRVTSHAWTVNGQGERLQVELTTREI